MSRKVPEVSGYSRARLETVAEYYVQKHFPELLSRPGPLDVLHFFDHILRDEYFLDTGVARLGAGVEGMTWPDGRIRLSEETYLRAAQGEGRARLTVVHEAGHGLLHQRQLHAALVHTGQLVLHRRGSLPAYKDPEWQATVFAAAMLMPSNAVKLIAAQCSNETQLVSHMRKLFKVSGEAAQIRVKTMNITFMEQ